MNFISEQIVAEYSPYSATAKKHDNPIDHIVIVQQAFEEIPEIISDAYVDGILEHFHSNFDNKILLDKKTIKQLIVSMSLHDKEE